MITLAAANAKGGTGKTTLAVHLAVGLARKGHRVVLVDLDPQGNATTWLLGQLGPGTTGIADAILRDGTIIPADLHTVPSEANLNVLPATATLSTVDFKLGTEVAGERALSEALAPLADRFDYAIVDCPPSMGMTVLAGLCAANAVLAPVLPAFFSLTGLRRLEETVARIRARLGAATRVLGYVLFAADPREAITAETRALLTSEAKEKLFNAEIRVSTAAKALPARRLTAWDPGADTRGADDYEQILTEVLRRLDPPASRRGSAAA